MFERARVLAYARHYGVRVRHSLRRFWCRTVVCPMFDHRFKFGPRCCIRCGEPLPPIR